MNGTFKSLLEQVDKTNLEKVPYLPITEYKKIIKDAGGKFDDDWETNGWQVDFWFYFEVDEKWYSLSGSWYYGDYKISREYDREGN